MTLRHYLMRTFLTTAALAIGQQWTGNPLHASEIASAVISSTQPTPTTFQYTIDLTDAGTTNIGTFWFPSVPGQGFLDSAPLGFEAPPNWTAVQKIVHRHWMGIPSNGSPWRGRTDAG